jgi:hypothetical protein
MHCINFCPHTITINQTLRYICSCYLDYDSKEWNNDEYEPRKNGEEFKLIEPEKELSYQNFTILSLFQIVLVWNIPQANIDVIISHYPQFIYDRLYYIFFQGLNLTGKL